MCFGATSLMAAAGGQPQGSGISALSLIGHLSHCARLGILFIIINGNYGKNTRHMVNPMIYYNHKEGGEKDEQKKEKETQA